MKLQYNIWGVFYEKPIPKTQIPHNLYDKTTKQKISYNHDADNFQHYFFICFQKNRN